MNTLLNAVKMTESPTTSCPGDCNGHGTCVGGNCVCEHTVEPLSGDCKKPKPKQVHYQSQEAVRYSGGSCTDANLGYFVGFGAVFYLVSFVSIVQLVWCVRSEFLQLKKPSLARACRLTVQKTLYLCMIVACGTRGVYYSVEKYLSHGWSENLFSAYYPVIISGFSVIICFWAEMFHVSGLRLDKPRFLKKSYLGCTVFNVLMYVVLIVQFITTEVTDSKTKHYLCNVFTAFFAGLMFIVLVFFLIYGVELYYKLRGAFVTSQASNVDQKQVVMSRFGLVSQASLQLLTSIFLMGDVMGNMWKDRLPVQGRNFLEVVFRMFELGVALWFTCCLWNCARPNQLWILNPKTLLRPDSIDEGERRHLLGDSEHSRYEATESCVEGSDTQHDCWVCYDTERTDAGPLIFPCQCKGDVAAVHHECLRRWLLESTTDSRSDVAPKCKVCREEYKLSVGRTWLPSLSVRYWLQTIALLSVMVGTPVGVYAFCLAEQWSVYKILIIGVAMILEYFCLRAMGFNMLQAYRKARLAAVTIIGRRASDRVQEEREEPTAAQQVVPASVSTDV